MKRFILLTQHMGPGGRFSHVTRLDAKSWKKAREEIKIYDEDHWNDGLCIGVPVNAEIIEIAKSEEVDFTSEDDD